MPSLSYRELCKILKSRGFSFAREGKGSHEIWVHNSENKRSVTVPFTKKDYKTGTANAIAKDLGFKNLQDLKNSKK